MSYKYGQWILGTSWMAAAMGLWFVAVPTWMSVSTFWWVNTAAVAVGAILVTSLRSARPSQSIAQVLYDTEHPTHQG